jgi:hypothetical protein
MSLQQILQESDYKLTQFKSEHIQELEQYIFEKEVRGKN